MNFNSPAFVEQLLWDARLADTPRGKNRAQIERLFNGLPPWTIQEQEQGGIKTNVNWLEAPKMAADARRTYYNAFLDPGNFFKVTLDSGNRHKRGDWGHIITNAISRRMKRSLKHFEMVRSQFAMTVLHGIGPSNWSDPDSWCPRPVGIEDVLVPSNTLLTMENLPYFGVFRQYTAMEFQKILTKANIDPGWNRTMMKSAIAWADKQVNSQASYTDLTAPQKLEERLKQDLGFYGSDAVPTIDCWDFYFHGDEPDGWRRRMVFDTPADEEIRSSGGKNGSQKMPTENLIKGERGQWLYNSNDRVFAEDLGSIMHWQFGDTTCSAPFRYHSVRSLGWLLYAVCHIQNRLRCKFNDAVFESLLQYIRTSNPDDKERILKIDLHDLGIVPEGTQFVKPEERWVVNHQLVGAAIQENKSMMIESAAQFREGRDTNQGQEKTATQIMAEVNAANALIGAMLTQAYVYQSFQHLEIARRFCRKDSRDPDVAKFRLQVLAANVPPELLDVEKWNVQTERVMGSGNKTLEIAIADKLMQARNLHDPESQREILHIYDLANTSNPDLASRLVPISKPRVSDSVHDAELASGALMQGLPVNVKAGTNHIEYVEVLLRNMAMIVKGVEERGGMAKPEEVKGLRTLEKAIQISIDIIAQDPQEGQRVKAYGDDLGKLSNMIRAYEQRLDAAAKQGADEDAAAKAQETQVAIQAKVMESKVKTEISQATAQQKLSQKEQSHRQKMAHEQQDHQADLAIKMREAATDAAAKDLTTAADIRREDDKPPVIKKKE